MNFNFSFDCLKEHIILYILTELDANRITGTDFLHSGFFDFLNSKKFASTCMQKIWMI
jgi:hypothetical protein